MAKFAKGEYLDGLNNGEPIFYKDEFTQKMVSEDKFSESKAYAIGDYCIYDNTLYKFTASKTAGAWNASVVEAVTITGELSELNSNLFDVNYISGVVQYTTASWTTGTGGFSYTIPKSGWYFLRSTFSGVSGGMTSAQFQLKVGTGAVGYNSVYNSTSAGNAWEGSMPIIDCCAIIYCSKGSVITPYIHTATAGVIIGTKLHATCIFSI